MSRIAGVNQLFISYPGGVDWLTLALFLLALTLPVVGLLSTGWELLSGRSAPWLAKGRPAPLSAGTRLAIHAVAVLGVCSLWLFPRLAIPDSILVYGLALLSMAVSAVLVWMVASRRQGVQSR